MISSFPYLKQISTSSWTAICNPLQKLEIH
ncbi:MAG: hypothetical protein ACI94Y_004549 [Maribacter sp.]